MPLQARQPISGLVPIRITRATVFRGRTVLPGEEFPDATGEEAATLMGCGKADRLPIPAPVRSAPAAPVIETASIEPRTETAATAPRRRTKNEKLKTKN